MIDPIELRLNNIVRIDSIITTVSHIMGDEDYFEPVELTPEILEAAGFGYNGNDKCFGYVNETEGILIELGDYYEDDGRAVFYYNLPDIDNSTCIAYCKHLHQLQNLYWCLCGQELQIDITKLNK